MKATFSSSWVDPLTKKQKEISGGNSESRDAYVLSDANSAGSREDNFTCPSCFL